ncbi:hypothetical protein [Candidatus Reidiella endopervernicosa]|uniref:Uncharacterized protein n=1 Tax=Candidatus Reidiella endopervernicosa TaxID=2738883 RepID=A0A6N0HR47_9GAMM|nr:hypothetical protein [Candidatus Reidiella endopervernicosa]QKQ24843.1 hypothetical protein HUE57_17305 [Candidatus Reidiella endopervernicosa]
MAFIDSCIFSIAFIITYIMVHITAPPIHEPPTITPGVAIFAKVCFGHPSPSKQQKLHATVYACGARPSCVRCVITSSRLYTTPSVTLRRHKAAAASSPSFARALNYEYTDGVDYRGLTALTSLSMAVSERSKI